MKSSFTFLEDLPLYNTEKPYELWLPQGQELPNDLPSTNCRFAEQTGIEVIDVRTVDCVLDLDSAGFKFVKHAAATNLLSEHLLKTSSPSLDNYLRETIRLVHEETQADKAICFDWRYRKSQQPDTDRDTRGYETDRLQALKPAPIVHQDDSPNGGRSRLRRHLTKEEVDDFDRGYWRIRFINVWRPLVQVVEDFPLALCDRRTVSGDDLVEYDKLHPNHVGEGLYLKYRRSQQWYWLSAQTKEEPVMFVTWDSRSDGMPPGPPHGAFRNPHARSCAPARESIEVRVMVFTRNTA